MTPQHAPWSALDRPVAPGVSLFSSRRTGATVAGVPIRVAVTPYHRAYCICGWISGHRTTVADAVAALDRHVQEGRADGPR